MAASGISTARRWSMLAIALGATLCANVFINGVAFLIPTLHNEHKAWTHCHTNPDCQAA